MTSIYSPAFNSKKVLNSTNFLMFLLFVSHIYNFINSFEYLSLTLLLIIINLLRVSLIIDTRSKTYISFFSKALWSTWKDCLL